MTLMKTPSPVRDKTDESASVVKNSCLGSLVQWLAQNEHIKKLLLNIDYSFIDKNLLLEAMTHASFISEVTITHDLVSNQRLEFLGDAVIETVISSEIFTRCPSLNEGEMSILRCSLVNEDALANFARSIGIADCLFLGKGEVKNLSMNRSSLLSDAFESLIGAIYLDGGFSPAHRVLVGIMESFEQEEGVALFSYERLRDFDAKSRLQEKITALYNELPQYVSVQLEDRRFKVELFIKKKLVRTVISYSKKRGEKMVAQQVLEKKEYIC